MAFKLMVGGIALLGTVTATLASWLVEAVAAEKQQTEDTHAILRRSELRIEELQLAASASDRMSPNDRSA